MKPSSLLAATCLGIVWVLSTAHGEEPTWQPLWGDKVPGETGKIGPEREIPTKPGQMAVQRITDVTVPKLAFYLPEKKTSDVFVIVAPGGGYNILAWDHEGVEVARWLNSLGVSAAVLKYRVPRRPGDPKEGVPPASAMDAQRAVRLVRSQAKELGISPEKIGMLGFSAGGHLTAWTSTNFDKKTYEPIDDADKQSARPDFAVLVYPAYLTPANDDSRLSPEIAVTEKTPPTFFAHAADDRVWPENSIRMFLELKKAKVPAELHIYTTGGHGFGLRPQFGPASSWPARCEEWLKVRKLLDNDGDK